MANECRWLAPCYTNKVMRADEDSQVCLTALMNNAIPFLLDILSGQNEMVGDIRK
jgi:hypothetical protein